MGRRLVHHPNNYNITWFKEITLDDMIENNFNHSKLPIFCPVDKENSPRLVQKSDFDPPVFRPYNEEGIKKYEKIKQEGKWFFLLRSKPYLPIELWLKILEFKYCHDKSIYLLDIFEDEIYSDSISILNLSENRKLEIELREENSRRLMLLIWGRLRCDTSLWSRYYEKNSVMDRLTIDIDELFCRKIEFKNSLDNPGDTTLNYVLTLLKIYKKWFFLLDRSPYLIDSTHTRSYNKDKIISFMKDCEEAKEFLFELVHCEDERFSSAEFSWEDLQVEMNKITQKDMCKLIMLDLDFLVRVYNIRCNYMDSPPDCPECLSFYYYFYEFSDYKKLNFSKPIYFNPYWQHSNEHGEKLIEELTRKRYYD